MLLLCGAQHFKPVNIVKNVLLESLCTELSHPDNNTEIWQITRQSVFSLTEVNSCTVALNAKKEIKNLETKYINRLRIKVGIYDLFCFGLTGENI